MLPRPWLTLVLLLPPSLLRAHPKHLPAEQMAETAQAWLDALDADQRSRAVFALRDDERENWHFVPRARKGIPLKEMSESQRKRARELIAAGLSDRAVITTDAIIALEDVLLVMENSPRRDRGLYFLTVFGTPSVDGTWGWRFEGHHLSVNFLIVDGAKFSVTPMFFGANPAEVRIDHAEKGRRALAAEEDRARALMGLLDAAQRQAAIISDRAPGDIITGNDREAKLAQPGGLAYAVMTSAQQNALRDLVALYAGRLRPELARTELQAIADRGWNAVHFAWAGGLERGQPHYYRIHGPDFVIEYDNVQNGGNHIHTTWRDFNGDFGRDLLREHHLEAHSSR